MEYLRLWQCCYSLFQIFQCPELSYLNVSWFIFWVHQSHTFQCHSAAELAPVEKCTFRNQSSPETTPHLQGDPRNCKHCNYWLVLQWITRLLHYQKVKAPAKSCINSNQEKKNGGREQKSQENLITEKDNIKLLM